MCIINNMVVPYTETRFAVAPDENEKKDAKAEDLFGVPEKPEESFQEILSGLSKNYSHSLEEDRTDPERKFTWGELHPNMTKGRMVYQAWDYIIKAENLQNRMDTKASLNELEKSDLRGYNNILATQFGPEGTASNEALSEMRDFIKEAFKNGVNPNLIKGTLPNPEDF